MSIYMDDNAVKEVWAAAAAKGSNVDLATAARIVLTALEKADLATDSLKWIGERKLLEHALQSAAPAPPAIRALIEKWRERQAHLHGSLASSATRLCADELEQALASQEGTP